MLFEHIGTKIDAKHWRHRRRRQQQQHHHHHRHQQRTFTSDADGSSAAGSSTGNANSSSSSTSTSSSGGGGGGSSGGSGSGSGGSVVFSRGIDIVDFLEWAPSLPGLRFRHGGQAGRGEWEARRKQQQAKLQQQGPH
jgi:hypothetical protein